MSDIKNIQIQIFYSLLPLIVLFIIKVKVAEINSNETCERTNVDTGSTTPPLSNITQNLVDSSITTNNVIVVDRGPPTPTTTEINNTQEANKGT